MGPRAPASVRTVYSILSDPLILGTTTAVAVMTMAWYFYASKKPSRILDQHTIKQFKLLEKLEINHNTSLYRFSLPRPTDVLGLPIGQHISIITCIDGEDVVRNYTPTTGNETRGYFDLVIKTYPTGTVSKYMANLKPGDTIDVQGPKGSYFYTPNVMKEIGMIAGGTGITPMLPIIKAILRNPKDTTKLTLIYANNALEDILLKSELDRLERAYPDQFRVHHVLALPPKDWAQGIGYVTKETLATWMPAPADNIQLLVCGTPEMMIDIEKATIELGYNPPRSISKLTDQVFKF
ncbi:uncharacterized protein BX664DRAFT_340194 [Halteromyces radiatus]|uniref:uncharacterized protein n=1 Tax=Halteromyces radiatus TaxID=101107 RepID=UPI00221F9D47|nr:uncharacterized protein BX664DRAFT_340194 [Halteromyces radiatus]KAI8081355.1 hypothetical protein BX664DRAFT_340194 [Halteromyces radiatus]